MIAVTLQVDAYIGGRMVSVRKRSTAESRKRAKRNAYRACMSELKRTADPRRYSVAKTICLETVTV